AAKCIRVFGTIQLGVGTKGGAEATIHAVRKLTRLFEEDPEKAFLQIDYSNAFNSINRTIMLEQVAKVFPEYYRWVEFRYGQPSNLLAGETIIFSTTGVHQGDPLGPLLFSLAMLPLCQEIQRQCPNLDSTHGTWMTDLSWVAP
ncbi:reverse transcriptase domain-containing protein, partial [Mycobacteroides abscessus]|uniref:reverse transcriptase domain-containing protein n=1 Tax=Mycobacteroides abscessus TaxID=36809 RepID=UPI001055B0BB